MSFDDTAIAFSAMTKPELKRAALLFKLFSYKWLVVNGPKLMEWALKIGLPIKGLVKSTIFKQFCGGETIEESTGTIQRLYKFNIGTILDYSVEGRSTEADFDRCKNEIISTIRKAEKDPAIPFCVFKVTGIARFELLQKLDEGQALEEEEEQEFEKVHGRITEICEAAYKASVSIFVDAEESWIQYTIDNLAYEMMEKYNKEKAIVYNTIQLYRTEGLQMLTKAHETAVAKQYFLGVKLVRGAYMEKERDRAQELGYPSPIQEDKEATDNDYNDALRFCVENIETIAICAGTHNEKSCKLLAELMHLNNIPKNDKHIYFSQLLGMSDNISFNLAKQGYNVAKYVPYGPVQEVMPYLSRRANENSSVAGQTSRELSMLKKEIARRKAA